MTLNWELIINQTIAQIIAAIALFVLSLFFLDQKKVVAPWLYKYFNKNFSKIVNSIIRTISLPTTRIVIALILIIPINFYGNWYYSALLVVFILTFFIKPESYQNFLPASELSDEFKNLNKWETTTGSPTIENNFGKPVPDVNLKFTGNNPTNSSIFLKDINANSGVIECDFYLEPGAVVNIIFLADKEKEAWYMARFDSRQSESDGFVLKEEGPGKQNWSFFKMSGSHTSVHEWHRARIVFNKEKVSMYRNEQLIVEFSDPQIFGNRIGMFNEVNDVHVDNFTFTKNI